MAREVISIEKLQEIEQQFLGVAQRIAESVKIARDAGMKNVLIHLKTLKNKHLPEVIAWSEGTEFDVKAEAKAFIAGVKSRASLQVEKAGKVRKASSEASPKKPKKRGE